MKKIKIGSYFALFSKKTGTKSLRLRLDKSGNLILTAPWYCRESQAISFALENLEWIEKQMQHVVPPRKFVNGDSVSILGTVYKICHNPTYKQGIKCENGALLIGGDIAFLHRRLTDFAKQELYAYIQAKAIRMAAQLGEKPHKITLRDTKTRWGSCSSRKDLNFCWKLVFAPLFVIDYIIAHEVSHLKEMNHSAAFWATVAQLNVEQAEAQIWLRKHGREIQAYM